MDRVKYRLSSWFRLLLPDDPPDGLLRKIMPLRQLTNGFASAVPLVDLAVPTGYFRFGPRPLSPACAAAGLSGDIDITAVYILLNNLNYVVR